MKYFAIILIILAISSCNVKYRGNDGQYNPNQSRKSNNDLSNTGQTGNYSKNENQNKTVSEQIDINEFYRRSGKKNTISQELDLSLDDNTGIDDFSRYSLIANNYLKAGNLSKAQTLFEYIKNSMLVEPLWFETCFSLAECHISNNNYQLALNEIKNILSFSEIPITIKEKSLIRAGQIECILGNKVKASKYFIKLRQEFPSSIFLPLADCNKI